MTRRQSTRRWREQGWATYEEAREAFRRLLEDTLLPGKSPGTPFPANANEYLLWLVEGHPRADVFLEHGLRHFTFHLNGRTHEVGRGGYGLTLVDRRGVSHPFSTSEALRGFTRSPVTLLQQALRREVKTQIDRVRDIALRGGYCCPETDAELNADNIEIDHVNVGLAELVSAFLLTERLRVEDVVVSRSQRLRDRLLAKRWEDYHFLFASLEAVTIKGHAIRTERRKLANPLYEDV